MSSLAWSMVWNWVKEILYSIADGIWDATWEAIYDAVAKAEKKYKEGDLVKDKKEFVIEKAIEYIESHERLGWIRKQVVKVFLNTVIDRMIADLNDLLGKDWVEKAKSTEDNWDDYFDFID